MTHVNAWRGDIGRQDLTGSGAQRAHRTRGGLPSVDGRDVWRVSDLSAFGGAVVPGSIAQRLRTFAASRSGHTGNGCPGSDDWRDSVPRVPMALGEWAEQKWHTVTVPPWHPDGAPWTEKRRGYPANGATPTIPPASQAELLDDLRWSRAVAAGTAGRRARLDARRVAFAATA